MTLSEAKQNAEAVADSAEMVLETIPEPMGKSGRELDEKTSELRAEVEDPESESKISNLTDEVKDLMEEAKQSAGEQPMDMGQEPRGGGIGQPPMDPGVR